MIGTIFKMAWGIVKWGVILAIGSSIIFVGYKGNQPMNVPEAPKGMSYFEFMSDRIDAAKTIKPTCGWGMISDLVMLGPIYSILYTEAGIHPDGLIAHMTAKDPDIPKGVAGAKWVDVPNIWWNTVERLSWTMLGRPRKFGCKFPVVNTPVRQIQ